MHLRTVWHSHRYSRSVAVRNILRSRQTPAIVSRARFLLQAQENGKNKSIGSFFRPLIAVERNYDTTEQKSLTVELACFLLRLYVELSAS